MGNKKYRGKYRIESARLKNYDYSASGAYFVTIVTEKRAHYFGEIVKGKMILNDIGKKAWDEWYLTLKIRPDMNLIMDEFIVMPNHVHGIVVIGENEYNVDQNTIVEYKNNFGPQRKNLSSIIRGFKSAVTRNARKMDVKDSVKFGWQERFHDRIIRDENELDRIRYYIVKNPDTWERDRNNDDDLWI